VIFDSALLAIVAGLAGVVRGSRYLPAYYLLTIFLASAVREGTGASLLRDARA